MGAVDEKLCDERHKVIEKNEEATRERLNNHSDRLKSVEEAIIVLTEMQKAQAKRDIFDKILIVSLAIMAVCFLIVIIGYANAMKVMETIKQIIP
jgi:uncharacterized membrane protein